MIDVKTISDQQFDRLKSYLLLHKEQWSIIHTEKTSTNFFELTPETLTAIFDKPLWGEYTRYVIFKGNATDAKSVEDFLNLKEHGTYIFKYNDDDRMIVVNPDEAISRDFVLNDASWWTGIEKIGRASCRERV